MKESKDHKRGKGFGEDKEQKTKSRKSRISLKSQFMECFSIQNGLKNYYSKYFLSYRSPPP